MLRSWLWTLRQPRYTALIALMCVTAAGCVLAGTWQISRFEQSVHENDALRANAHAAAAPLTTSVVDLVGHGRAPSRTAITFRTIEATGRYLAGPPQFVGDQSLHGVEGYYVMSPFQVGSAYNGGSAVLLVVRGFVAEGSDGHPPTTVAAPPSGVVRISGRLSVASTGNDEAGTRTQGEIRTINPAQQASRLGAPVFNTYAALTARQPGTAGLRILAAPDLSNPAGGAYEAQHFAYIIQWYLFALLALGAPFAIGRSEVRETRLRFLGLDPGEKEFGLEPGAASHAELDAGPSAHGAVVLRSGGAVAVRGEPTAERWRQAQRLADRYGRSLGPDAAAQSEQVEQAGQDGRTSTVRRRPGAPRDTSVAPSTATPHRSVDAYHGSYNDYLWQLSLADGSTPTVELVDDANEASPAQHAVPLMMRRPANEPPRPRPAADKPAIEDE